jgi:hypothetical protein
MSNAVWKEFEDNALTHSAAHYLMTIKDLREEYFRVPGKLIGLSCQ